mmetsp:Transcript_42497/g.136338  ORF Transcript_42497/g.136338 Transcript_42497/m.136338 type:complete len:203 (-) Transcript_42497:923-1531(-)
MDLSASHVMRRVPVWSNPMAKSPLSLSRDPGCTVVWLFWKLFPLFQSHIQRLPLSPPVAITPSSLMAMQLTIAFCWSSMLCRRVPSGSLNFLMLSAEADAKAYSLGCMAMARTDFLWYVSVELHLPAARSQVLIVESWDPVITWGSVGWERMEQTVLSWPERQCTCCLVRMSHTRHVESRPPVMSTSSVGCSVSAYTPLRCP